MADNPKADTESSDTHEVPRLHEVHANPEHPLPSRELPDPLTKPVAQKSPARWAYERLILYIRNFEEQLDSKHEVAMGFTGGDAGVLRIEGMGYFDPDIVTFYGSEANGARTQLIQHVSQLNVMLRALPKPQEDGPAKRIGFRLAADLEDGDPD